MRVCVGVWVCVCVFVGALVSGVAMLVDSARISLSTTCSVV
jgi:hypothetical protein